MTKLVSSQSQTEDQANMTLINIIKMRYSTEPKYRKYI